MILRTATLEDAVQIAHIHRIARSKAMPWLPVIHTPDEDLAFFSQKVLPQQNVRVVDLDDRIAGFIAFHDDWINHLYIHPEFWRRGLGTTLLTPAKAGSSALQLWTFQKNTIARTFYSNQNFNEAEFTDGHNNEERTPDVRMVWSAARSSLQRVGRDLSRLST